MSDKIINVGLIIITIILLLIALVGLVLFGALACQVIGIIDISSIAVSIPTA